MAGQITLASEFGRQLAALAANPSLRTFVEVGSWNGQGTTLCIAEGFRARPDLSGVTLLSFETNAAMFEKAREYWSDKGLPIEIRCGRVAQTMMPLVEIMTSPTFNDVLHHFLIYYQQDVIDFHTAPLHTVEAADMILLDGGEFSTYQDWMALRGLEPKVVALDDTRVMKCERLLRELKEAKWEVLFESEERNGCAILQNPSVPTQ